VRSNHTGYKAPVPPNEWLKQHKDESWEETIEAAKRDYCPTHPALSHRTVLRWYERAGIEHESGITKHVKAMKIIAPHGTDSEAVSWLEQHKNLTLDEVGLLVGLMAKTMEAMYHRYNVIRTGPPLKREHEDRPKNPYSFKSCVPVPKKSKGCSKYAECQTQTAAGGRAICEFSTWIEVETVDGLVKMMDG
jgi:hypothetical protein